MPRRNAFLRDDSSSKFLTHDLYRTKRHRKWKIARLMGDIIINRLTLHALSRISIDGCGIWGDRIDSHLLVLWWTSLSSDLMHLKRTHLVRAASFFPNSISCPYNYLSPVSFYAALLASYSSFLSLGPLYRVLRPRIYTVMNSMTREKCKYRPKFHAAFQAEMFFLFVPVNLIMLQLDWTVASRRIVNIYINIHVWQ